MSIELQIGYILEDLLHLPILKQGTEEFVRGLLLTILLKSLPFSCHLLPKEVKFENQFFLPHLELVSFSDALFPNSLPSRHQPLILSSHFVHVLAEQLGQGFIFHSQCPDCHVEGAKD